MLDYSEDLARCAIGSAMRSARSRPGFISVWFTGEEEAHSLRAPVPGFVLAKVRLWPAFQTSNPASGDWAEFQRQPPDAASQYRLVLLQLAGRSLDRAAPSGTAFRSLFPPGVRRRCCAIRSRASSRR